MTVSDPRHLFTAAALSLTIYAVGPQDMVRAEVPSCTAKPAGVPVVHYRTAKVDGVDVFIS